ncbi:hypothetical protein AURDEDRAFT_180269 [Auricularia subglabra TFB-10046 SS5]|nr:hypothetical protein AURDEDRAFT_180269 [Auricularia subglabra TFB-10046 SS5]
MGSAVTAEKKEKKRKQREDAVDAVVVEDEQPKTKKRKRDRQPAEDSPIDAPSAEAPHDPDADETKRKKKRKELTEAAPGEDEQPADAPKRKSKKRDSAVATETEPPAPDDAHNLDDSSSKKKKKKRQKDKAADEEDLPGKESAKASKKYPDPAKDKTLSERSQKGLAYAYSYATSSDWKFNKARQNWLMKHAYDSAMIPDEYLRMVFHYLKSIKGQALEHLRKTCQTAIDWPTNQEPPDAETSATTGAEEAKARSERAATLLKKLPRPVAATVAEE